MFIKTRGCDELSWQIPHMTNKGVFITGAASGIGLATALKFAGEGWRVSAADIDGEALRRDLGGHCVVAALLTVV